MKNIRDAIWGFVVGDALGVPYEFSSRSRMKDFPATGMTGYGMHDQPPGTWSDDTSMMLCVLENILQKGDIHSLAKLFLKWYQGGYMTAHGEVFDIGITTRQALQRLETGAKPSMAGSEDEFSSGNGSLMRSLPYAFVDNIQESIFNMTRENRITHRNSICSYCCMIYVKMLRALLEGSSKEEAFKSGIAYIKFGWRITNSDDDHEEERQWFKRLFSVDFAATQESEIKSTGYVLSTLEATCWCFLNTDNYKDAVLKAVDLGGDTDTIAALTGGLAGIFYGYDSIPQEWLKMIVSKDLINNLLNELGTNQKYI